MASVKTIKLYHRAVLIGTITNVLANNNELLGAIDLLPSADAFRPVFAWIIRNEKTWEEPPFNDELLWNWYVEFENGLQTEIVLPCIYAERLIVWREL
ncbi:MAG: hypothetical protein C0473_01550 [Cyanobacteria bacterium DS3.002]|nr:hypothetical protein [Cyanobacteria bacterium DS3.002]MBA4049571.1 hypothetical protein [Cyanobacteria bacterium DS2.008]